MTIEQSSEEPRDEFPVGMRVLAVDDDPICLKVLETKLRKCQYHVTTTNQAIVALKLLRDNKNKFDLVISDVHMPDMDGFKLLELVGLEMDLPVIMLSANGDQRLVMKGITHGACDYLLKPVRIEELKNIWQHVIRKKKSDPKDKNSDKHHHGSEEGQMLASTGDSDQNSKFNRKRKDQVEDEDDDRGEYGQDNEDSSAQKKPRVVWTVDLHQKFVAAVNQLGIEKAVPKRILDMMNVEKLTRENVASHLQKYRLYLRRISSVQSQQANMAAAFGGVDPAYLRMTSLNGFGNIHSMASTAQLQNVALRSFSSNGMLGRLNTPAGLGIRGLSSPGVVQLDHLNGIQTKFEPVGLHGRQNVNILQGVPTSLEFDHLGDLTSMTSDPMGFNASSGFSTGNIMSYNSNGIQSSTAVTSNREVPLDLPDLTRFNDGWPTIQSSAVQSNSLRHEAPPIRMAATNSYPAPISGGFSDLRTDFQSQSASTAQYPNLMSNSVSPYGVSGSLNPGVDLKSTPSCNIMNDLDTIGQQNVVDPLVLPQSDFQQSAVVGVKQGYSLDHRVPSGVYSYNNVGCLEDLVSAMMKKEEEDFSNDFGLR